MTELEDPPGFTEWLHELFAFAMVRRHEPSGSVQLSPADLRSLRDAYNAEVPASTEVRVPALMAPQVALASEAVAAVLGDVHRTTSSRPEVVVDVWEAAYIRISINGGFTTPSMLESESPEAFAEVADYFQDQLADELGCWPLCERHDLGLHPEVHDGVAIWWCRRFQHAVASIGSLGETGRVRRKTKRH